MEATAEGRWIWLGHDKLMLPPVPPGVSAAFDAISEGRCGLEELTTLAGRDGWNDAAIFHGLLQRLHRHGVLARALRWEGSVLATLAPAAPQVRGPVLREEVSYALSRFAFTHRVDGSLVLETPLSRGRVWMPTWHGSALLGALSGPKRPGDFAAVVPGIPADAAGAFMRMLAEAGALTETGSEGAPIEPEALATWEFHDLLFHRQTRWGKRDDVYGGATYRFRGRLPEPGKKPPPTGERIPLEVPDLAAAERRDPPFTTVLERRRSIREHGSRPVTRTELGELLYRAVGLRQTVLFDRGEGEARPYPSGGGLYETGVYVVANRCEGLKEGLYYYRVEDHALYHIAGRTPDMDLLLKTAMATSLRTAPPQVLFILTARFARMAWKYETMAYAAMIKHVGVIFQTLYLVATAMGLAPCALGAGNAEVFARLSGLDPLEEGSVGEFMLGTRPDEEST